MSVTGKADAIWIPIDNIASAFATVVCPAIKKLRNHLSGDGW